MGEDLELGRYKVKDCPLLPWHIWKTTFADCKRCRCAASDVVATLQEHPDNPYVECATHKVPMAKHFPVVE